MNNKTFIIILVLLASIAAIGLASYVPARFDSAVAVGKFPVNVGEWTGTDCPVSARTYEILETKNLFVRDYKNKAGDSVYLYVVYSEVNRKVSHPPEVCMLGSGATVVSKVPLQVTPAILANKLIIESKTLVEIIAYWYKAGGISTDSYTKQQMKVVMDRLRFKRTSCAMVRLSTEVKNGDYAKAEQLIKKFAGQIEPLLQKYVP